MQLPAVRAKVAKVTVRVAVQQVDDGIAAIPIAVVAWRQIDRNLGVGGLAQQVALERFAVNLDAFERALQGHRCRRG
jgi:hypothetical protein